MGQKGSMNSKISHFASLWGLCDFAVKSTLQNLPNFVLSA